MDEGFYRRINGSQLPAGTSQHTHGASFSIEPRPLICMRVTGMSACPEKSSEHLIQLTSCCSEVYFTDYDKYDNWGDFDRFLDKYGLSINVEEKSVCKGLALKSSRSPLSLMYLPMLSSVCGNRILLLLS